MDWYRYKYDDHAPSYRTWHDFDDFDEVGRKYSESYLKEQGRRYGLDPTLPIYQREDTGSAENFDQDGHFLNDLLREANNDYDYRRASEAAKLHAGNVDYEFADKKWSEMSDSERKGLKREEHMANKEAGVVPDPRFANVPSSINSLEDVFNANKFMRDTYENEGLGDEDYLRAYGDPSQRAAVKDYWVDTDRANFLDNQIKDKEPKSSTPLTDELAQKGAPLSEEAQAAQDFLNERVAAIRDGTHNDSYRRMGSGYGPAGTTTTAASDALKAEMEKATGKIDVNEFAKQSALERKSLENDFSRSMNSNIFDENSFSNSIFR